ncbi:hypothetical protein JMJ55_16150 [Belnapia sp. T6]|uniref:Uncharacterized protein n=1 Tax=Belnapia mucosa TaxID=2804532 RepID=A0ABS1V595_9PROT|nr:hypothetical protein [Belnapia mucosa]MBL6456870.1 hypothetical protein [Belnapia mucosa]
MADLALNEALMRKTGITPEQDTPRRRLALAARHALANLAFHRGALARSDAANDLLHDRRRYTVPLRKVGDLLFDPCRSDRIDGSGLRIIGLDHSTSLAKVMKKLS